MIRISSILCFVLLCCTSFGQKTYPTNGVADERNGRFAFTNATIITAPGKMMESATLVINKGKVEAVGQNITIPPGTVSRDLNGAYIYPSFIDLYTKYGLPEAEAAGKKPKKQPQMLSNKKGAYSWNEALKPEFSAVKYFTPDPKTAKEFRNVGFGTVLSHQMDGISRGTSTLVFLGEEPAVEAIAQPTTAHHLSFKKGKSTQNYPSSLMGAISLLRQTYYDASWYKQSGYKEETNLSLQAWNDINSLPEIFEVGNKLEALRAIRLGKEFKRNYIIKGNGDEYQRLDYFKKMGTKFIIDLNFPKVYDVEDPFDAQYVTLKELKHWELAPSNPARLENAGLDFSLTTHELKSKADFLKHLRKAIKNGLSEDDALKALTTTPAAMIKLSNQLGTLERGKWANFIITSQPVFEEDATILENWVKGKSYHINTDKGLYAGNKYELTLSDSIKYRVDWTNKKNKPSLQIVNPDSSKIKVNSTFTQNLVSLSFIDTTLNKSFIRLSGIVDKNGKLSGEGMMGDGTWVNWSMLKTDTLSTPTKEKKSKEDKTVGSVVYPFMAYGWTQRPESKTVLIKNATVWTNESAGILKNTDVLVSNGKIKSIGKDLPETGAEVVDGTDKHLTCGIVDEHSHIAISRGVNEGTQVSSAEVRIGDVVNSDDINIYRQLAGGVTTSQLLHGSANPIGGQSAIIKLRWGFTPEEMKFENATPFIKFALGENVKQTNWGDEYTIRFPQTRMGIEQVYEDYFTRAKAYGAKKKSGKPYRMDLDMEALLEIVDGKRQISCHSYQQGEINMLMKVAERHGFKVNTFTHILEGYKVADKMKKHGAAGSTFSDWWAYKYEVIDAIPYNGAIMHEQGVLTGFNSDDAEMARRLNQEAAKAIKYGNVSEEDAWKFVTLNPAKMLHIDDRVGSIKVGKDADLVLWSMHPMSIYAVAEQTYIDGIKFFDRNLNQDMSQEVKAERSRLIQKSLAAKKGGSKTQPVKVKTQHLYHCDDIHDEMNHSH